MHLKHLRKVQTTISFKISVWYAGIFTLSILVLFLLAYFYFSITLKKQDHEEIKLELQEVSSLYGISGIGALGNFITENSSSKREKPLFIRVADSANKTLHIFTPQLWRGFDLTQLEKSMPPRSEGWIRLNDRTGEDILEILSTRLSKGNWIQVGMNSHQRETTLKYFRKLFALAMLPLILVGLAGGIFVSHRFLQPIRQLIRTVHSVDSGQMETRVPLKGTEDELEELARLFNNMLDRINNLIQGMKESLDNVSHDLRTPMTRFRNIAEIALRGNKNVDFCKEALSDAVEESEHILKMLDTLMDISEAQTGVLYLNHQLTDFPTLIYKVVDMYQYVAEEKGLQLHVEAPQNLLITIDSNRMSQVCANLLDNAIKFTPSGGRITVEIRLNDQEAIIVVQDNGIGISAKDLPRIWDRLYRSNQSGHQKGLGLGLSLVKGIVKAHKGRIDIVSEPGMGSTFTITLPAEIQEASFRRA